MHYNTLVLNALLFCNVTQSIVKMLTMFNKHLRMDEKSDRPTAYLGLMKITLLAFSMHFKCFDNALQYTGSKCIVIL